MATVIASNLTVFADATGHGCQSHLVYAANQQRWWCFVVKTKTATTVSTYVSSSNDLTTATWSASTSSPVFPNSRALSTSDQRNLAVCSITNGTTDAAHVSVGVGPGTANGYVEHIRCTFTGASSITWESWVELAAGSGIWDPIKGNALGVSTPSKYVHESTLTLSANEDANVRKSSNADSGATWTNAFAANVVIDSSITNSVNAYAIAPLASDVMLCVYENGGLANPNCTGLRYTKSGATGTWSAGSGTGAVATVSSFDLNDWCLCGVDVTHTYAFYPSSATQVASNRFSGSAWSAPANAIPTHARLAGSGMFAATDGTEIWLFLIDSATNGPIYYVKSTGANGSSISWGSWTQFEPAGSTARNYISGYPVVANNQIGVTWTAVNGTNFDIMVDALTLSAAAAGQVPWHLFFQPALGQGVA